MKTKSKRFLNLATLCLALLGTTLLIAQPVKAEVTVATTEGVHQTAEAENEDIIKEEYMTLLGLSDSDLQNPLEEARYKGYVDGYRKGFGGEDRIDRSAIKDLYYNVPSSEDGEYRDGYEQGFEKGRHANYPVRAFLEDLLGGLWGFLTGIFGDGSSDTQ
ncbi:TPA: hypothetical protein VJO59_000472 [Streptococcus pyogenes]|nr:hypothetical protein [Streptococcus pyogenes]HER1858530.1 hypothetical protein [Streptococcus pyogenes]HER4567401.1 hypothetical protein [Streptococcus pyogenes NGAS640]